MKERRTAATGDGASRSGREIGARGNRLALRQCGLMSHDIGGGRQRAKLEHGITLRCLEGSFEASAANVVERLPNVDEC